MLECIQTIQREYPKSLLEKIKRKYPNTKIQGSMVNFSLYKGIFNRFLSFIFNLSGKCL